MRRGAAVQLFFVLWALGMIGVCILILCNLPPCPY